VAKPQVHLVVPILFFVEAAFWPAIVATGGGTLLLFATLACVVSGVLLLAMPTHWVTRPVAGASALLVLTLTVYQFYEASTLFGSNLSTFALTSAAIFGVFAIISIYLEFAMVAMGREPEPEPKALKKA
jgi:hypothetical protein